MVIPVSPKKKAPPVKPVEDDSPKKKEAKPANPMMSPPPANKKKTIWSIKQRVEFEIAHNILRPDNQEGDGPSAYSKEIGEQEATERFWELYQDFFSEKYIQGKFGRNGLK